MGQPPDSTPGRSLESYLERLESLLREVLRAGALDLRFAIRKADAPPEDLEAPEFIIDFSGPDSGLLLEKHGALLDALEHVILKAVRLDEELLGKITFDCEDWRRMRAVELRLTAQMAAERALESGDPYELNPMTPRERRIVHLALRDMPNIRTASEGRGPERRVVIHPAHPPVQPRE
jgi:spoIIIJ-associated protein